MCAPPSSRINLLTASKGFAFGFCHLKTSITYAVPSHVVLLSSPHTCESSSVLNSEHGTLPTLVGSSEAQKPCTAADEVSCARQVNSCNSGPCVQLSWCELWASARAAHESDALGNEDASEPPSDPNQTERGWDKLVRQKVPSSRYCLPLDASVQSVGNGCREHVSVTS